MTVKYKAVLFDLDGTLLDSLEDLWASTNYALRKYDLPERSIDEVRQFIGNGLVLLIERAIPAGSSIEMRDKVLAAFREHYAVHCKDKSRIYEGLEQVLYRLGCAGVKTALVSNKPDFAVQEVYNFYYKGLVDFAVGEKPGLTKKPSPDLPVAALQALGVRAADAVYVGDSDVDIATAANSNMPCISVTWGFRSEQFVRSHGATVVVHNAQELWEALIN